ncbi:MAG: 50S ribosomal protein L29 [Elusimicrobia bacterium]|nr:50S ribosomal protein L29 [Elusimicrobiota bacterium]
MKRREINAKRDQSVGELKAELRTTREKQFKLKFKHGVTPLENPTELRSLRRHIARLETWIREKATRGQA